MGIVTPKPLGHKSYGTIGHLPNSRLGPADRSVHEGQSRICQEKARKGDTIIIQEKLDGSNVGVARIDGELVPLGRAGYLARTSPYEQHRMFDRWVERNADRFAWLPDGSRACGEWLAQAHGTRYELFHAPFVVFDVMTGHDRLAHEPMLSLIGEALPTPFVVSTGSPLCVEHAMRRLGDAGRHGAVDPIEGVVYRVERNGKVDFLAKWVRPDKVDGSYLPEISGGDAVWNWTEPDLLTISKTGDSGR